MIQRSRVLACMVLIGVTCFASVVDLPVVRAQTEAPEQMPDRPGDGLYQDIASETLEAFRSGRFDDFAARLAPSFLEQVPLATMNTISRDYQRQFGRVLDVVFDGQRDDPTFAAGTLFYWVMTEGNRRAVMRVKLGEDQRVIAWHIGPSMPVTTSFTAVREQLEGLDGTVSALAIEAGGASPIFSVSADETLAIGSAFKLYVLAEFLRQCDDGKCSLDSVLPLQTSKMSGPSGRLHRWPESLVMTAESLAALMISESDNTATDHLIDWLGRSNLERRLAEPFGNSAAERNRPFLKTRELFLLQGRGMPWSGYRERFLAGSIPERREVLRELAREFDGPMPLVDAVGGTFGQLEWYASTRDLAEIMAWLYDESSFVKPGLRRAARGILAINPGIPNSPTDPRIEYLGYKGGSEPGVLNLTQYVETKDGRAFVLVLTWNNPVGDAQEPALIAALQTLRSAVLDSLDPDPTHE